MSGGKTVAQLLAEAAAAVPFMSLAELKARIEAAEQNLIVLDVRERDAYESGHIPGARLLPRGQLELRVNDDLLDPRSASLRTVSSAVFRRWLRRRCANWATSAAALTGHESLARSAAIRSTGSEPPRARRANSSLFEQQTVFYRGPVCIDQARHRQVWPRSPPNDRDQDQHQQGQGIQVELHRGVALPSVGYYYVTLPAQFEAECHDMSQQGEGGNNERA